MNKTKILEKEGFWAVPKVISSNRQLTQADKGVFGILWTRKNGDNEAFPSETYISQHLGISERQVRRATQRLEKNHYITRIKRGNQKTNRYLLHLVTSQR